MTAHCWPGLNLDMTISHAGLTATDNSGCEAFVGLIKLYFPLGLGWETHSMCDRGVRVNRALFLLRFPEYLVITASKAPTMGSKALC